MYQARNSDVIDPQEVREELLDMVTYAAFPVALLDRMH
jgi:hypothetical protein